MWALVCDTPTRSAVLAEADNLIAMRTMLGRIVLDRSVRDGVVPEPDYWLDAEGNLCEGVSYEVCHQHAADGVVRLFVRRIDMWLPPPSLRDQIDQWEGMEDDEDEPF
jgi:hypothetical protein